MAQKTLIFTKKPLDLSNNKEVGANIVGFGHYRFFLKNFRKTYGHDDSLPYNAELWLKNTYDGTKPIKLGRCSNDGWGGTTNIWYEKSAEELANTLEQDVKNYKWKYGKGKNMVITLDIPFIADILAETENFFSNR